MQENKIPLSYKELDDFLTKLDSKKCPWCDGHNWGLQYKTQDSDDTPKHPYLRALSKIDLTENVDGGIHGTITTGLETALPVTVVECLSCGYLYFFNYFSIMNKIKNDEEK